MPVIRRDANEQAARRRNANRRRRKI